MRPQTQSSSLAPSLQPNQRKKRKLEVIRFQLLAFTASFCILYSGFDLQGHDLELFDSLFPWKRRNIVILLGRGSKLQLPYQIKNIANECIKIKHNLSPKKKILSITSWDKDVILTLISFTSIRYVKLYQYVTPCLRTGIVNCNDTIDVSLGY